MHTAVKPCVLWTFPNNRFQLKLARYISHIWTAIPDKNINICRLCGVLNNDIIRHSVAECRVTLPLREHFIHWVMNVNGIELRNELISCDPEHFLITVLGARYDSKVPDEHLNVLISCGFLFIKEYIDFAE